MLTDDELRLVLAAERQQQDLEAEAAAVPIDELMPPDPLLLKEFRRAANATFALTERLAGLDRLADALHELVDELRRDRPHPSPYMTIEEAAEYMRTFKATINTLMAKGRLPSSILNGHDVAHGRRVIHRSDADAYLRSVRLGSDQRLPRARK